MRSADQANSQDGTVFHLGCSGEPCEPLSWVVDQHAFPESFIDRRTDSNTHNVSRWEALTYQIATHRFPTAQSCLTRGSKSEAGYDLTNVNWRALRSDAKAKVCLFRIHTAIGDAGKSLDWFRKVGFEARLQRFPNEHFMAGSVQLFSVWIRGDDGAKSPFGWRENWPRKALSYGAVTVGVSWSPNGSIGNVSLNYTLE